MIPGNSQNAFTAQAIEIAIRLGVLFLIIAWSLQILAPFVSVIAWGAIIASATTLGHEFSTGKAAIPAPAESADNRVAQDVQG